MRINPIVSSLLYTTGAINWNFFSSTVPDLEHGQDFSNFFHEVVQEHQEELHEIEEQQEEHAAIVEEETRNLTSLMIKLQKMFDQAEEEEKELEAEENKTKEKEELQAQRLKTVNQGYKYLSKVLFC